MYFFPVLYSRTLNDSPCRFQLPVPVFLPTTLHGADQIVETISQLKRKESTEQLPPDETSTEDEKPGTLIREFSRCWISVFSSQIALLIIHKTQQYNCTFSEL